MHGGLQGVDSFPGNQLHLSNGGSRYRGQEDCHFSVSQLFDFKSNRPRIGAVEIHQHRTKLSFFLMPEILVNQGPDHAVSRNTLEKKALDPAPHR